MTRVSVQFQATVEHVDGATLRNVGAPRQTQPAGCASFSREEMAEMLAVVTRDILALYDLPPAAVEG